MAGGIGSHTHFELVAIAPGLLAGHAGSDHRFGGSAVEAGDAHQLGDRVGPLGFELGFVGHVGPGAAPASAGGRAGGCHAGFTGFEHLDRPSVGEALLVFVDFHAHEVAGGGAFDENGLAVVGVGYGRRAVGERFDAQGSFHKNQRSFTVSLRFIRAFSRLGQFSV